METTANRPSRWIVPCAAVLGFMAWGTPAQAQLLYSSGTPSVSGGFESAVADSNSDYVAGITFIPTASGSANTLTFAGSYDPGFTGQNGSLTPPPDSDDFTISLYTGTPSPANLLESSTLVGLTRSALGSNSGREIYEFSATLNTALALMEGSSYFIGVTDLDTPDDSFFTYGSSSSTGTGYQSSDSGQTFAADGIDTFNFSVSEKAVPEPPSWGMLLVSIALLAIWQRGSKRGEFMGASPLSVNLQS